MNQASCKLFRKGQGRPHLKEHHKLFRRTIGPGITLAFGNCFPIVSRNFL